MLVNEYEVTEKRYIQWVYESRREGKKGFFLFFWALLMIGCIILFCVYIKDYLFLVFAGYCLYRAILRDYFAARNHYKKALALYADKIWKRIVSISENGIVIDDGRAEVKYELSDIVKSVQNEERIRLFMNDNNSIRLYKDSFTEGDLKDYFDILKLG